MKNLLPKEAWALIQQRPDAVFVDVRMEIESMSWAAYRRALSNHAWYEYPELQPDPPHLWPPWRARHGQTSPVRADLPLRLAHADAGDGHWKQPV